MAYADSLYGRQYSPRRASLNGFFLLLFAAVVLPAAWSGETVREAFPGEFFVGASAETALYSSDGAAFGGGLAAGYGFDIGALGVRLDYLVDPEGLATLTPGLFLRFYIPLPAALQWRSAPFLQLDFGPTFHGRDGRLSSGGTASAVSAGLTAGWRFLLADHWYAEPSLRGGYPFITGGGVSAGYRF
jgi:hypothetical protein